MEIAAVPPALRERLGDRATLALLEFSELRERALRDELLNVAVERFERRLAEELGALRVEMAREFALVRQETAQGLTSVRQETLQGLMSVRQELAATRADLLKWSFLFWIGQVAVLSSLMALMLHGVSG